DDVVYADSHPAHAAAVRIRRARHHLSHIGGGARRPVRRRSRARDARDRVEQAGVAALQVLAALPGAAVRRDGRRPRTARLTDAAAEGSRRPASDKSRSRSPKPLARLAPRVAPYRGRLAAAAVCLLVAASVGLAFPQVVRHLLDAAFEQHDRSLLDRIAIGLVAMFALQGLMNFVQVYLLTSTTERVVAGLRQDAFAHLVRLSPGFFADRRTGELTSRLSSDLTI